MKSGFIALIGRPNAGKSTLMNNLLQQKIAIISPKAQTTRNQIRGILTTDDAQMVEHFTDEKVYFVLGDYENKKFNSHADGYGIEFQFRSM